MSKKKKKIEVMSSVASDINQYFIMEYGLYFQCTMGIRTIILNISLNTEPFISKVAYPGYDNLRDVKKNVQQSLN